MEKNQRPFSEPCKLRLAFATDFSSFGYAHGRLVYGFKPSGGWRDIKVVPGSLTSSCEEDGDGFYDVNISFRVSYATNATFIFLNQFVGVKLIAAFESGGEQERIAGLVSNPLQMRLHERAGFDGYECELTGKQSVSLSYSE